MIYIKIYKWIFLIIKRLFFKNINGFFDKAILGSGDTYLLICINSNFSEYILTINKYLSSQIIIYKEHFQSLDPKVTYLPCNIYHLYHGSIIQRNYDFRYKDINLDNWDSIFQLNSDGFWEFTDSSMDSLTFNYFKSRKEDLAKYVKTSDIGIQARPDTKDAANNPSLISVRSIRK